MNNEKKYCPNCNYLIDNNSKQCPNCNKQIITECKYCKKEINADATICPYCKKKQKKSSGNSVMIITVAICIILVIAFAYNNDVNNFSDDLDSIRNNNSYSNDNKTTTNTKSEEEIKKETIEKYKNECVEYDYKTIFRYAEDYKGKYAKFTGEVIQVQSTSSYSYLRINVTKNEYGFYTDTIFVRYEPFKDATRILEDDIVTVYGTLNGVYTYISIFNQEVTLPYINSKYIEITDNK